MITYPPTITPTSISTSQFPPLHFSGEQIRAGQFIEPGTQGAVVVGYMFATLGVLIGGLFTYGILWIALLFSPLIEYLNRKKTMALIKGSSIQVGPDQFPELFKCATAFSQRLGMKKTPDVYIVESNTINASAVRVSGRKVIILMDDIVDACLKSEDPQTIAFILGHEMAHHALGHTNMIRASLAKYHRKLSRLDEFSCDAVANQLVGQTAASARAVVTLLSGPQLLKYVNFSKLCEQAMEVVIDKNTLKAERPLSHPLLLRRLARLVSYNNNCRS